MIETKEVKGIYISPSTEKVAIETFPGNVLHYTRDDQVTEYANKAVEAAIKIEREKNKCVELTVEEALSIFSKLPDAYDYFQWNGSRPYEVYLSRISDLSLSKSSISSTDFAQPILVIISFRVNVKEHFKWEPVAPIKIVHYDQIA